MARSTQINPAGNINGSIVIEGHQLFIHTQHGAFIDGLVTPQVKLRSLPPQPPHAPQGFINRTSELARLENWLGFGEIVLLHATDGLGKTALLRQVAYSEAAQALPGGVVWLESPGFEGQNLGPDDILQQLFEALCESRPPLKVNPITARPYLAGTRPLVILDEVPLPPTLQRALPDLIPQGAFLLAADLPTGGEFQRLAVGPLPREEAARLLAERAGVAPTETLKFICGVLEDISLAIIITGNLMRVTHMNAEQTLLALGSHQMGGMDPIAIAIDRAYRVAFDMLGEAERKILSVAALTPGVSLASDWLKAALGANPQTSIERLKALGLLTEDGDRLRLPPGLRLTAHRRSVLDAESLYPKLLKYLLAGLPRGDAFIQAELGNLFGVLDWATRANRSTEVLALGRALDPYLTLHGLWDAWGNVLESILNASIRLGDRATEAWALHQLGTRLIGLENIPQATKMLKQALKLRLKLGDRVGAAYTQHNLDFLFPMTRPIAYPARFPVKRKIWLALIGLILAASAFIGWFYFLR